MNMPNEMETSSSPFWPFASSSKPLAGWAEVRLQSLVYEVQSGFASGSYNRTGTGIPHLRPMNVTPDGKVTLGDAKYVDRSLASNEARLLRNGDVIFNNTNSPELVGKTALYDLDHSCAFSNHMTRIRCKEEILDPAYCAFVLQFKWMSGYFQAVCNNHVSQASVSRAVLLTTPIPLPPLTEQKRLVGKIESLMTQVSAIRSRLRLARGVLKRFRHAVLVVAATGHLTADWREHNGASDNVETLLNLIEKDRKDRHRTGETSFASPWHGSRAKRPRLLEDRQNLPELPAEWVWSPCDELCMPGRALTYGVIKLGPRVESGVPTLRSSNVRHLRIDASEIKRISRKVANNYRRTYLAGGEILVTVRGTLGGVAMVPPQMSGFNVSREVAVVPLEPALVPDFFMYAIGSNWSQNWLLESSKGVTYTGINIEDLRRLPLPLPPISEQRELVRRVENLLRIAKAVENRIELTAARADKLSQSILAKAFRGELVVTEAELARREGRAYKDPSVLFGPIGPQREARVAAGRVADKARVGRTKSSKPKGRVRRALRG